MNDYFYNYDTDERKQFQIPNIVYLTGAKALFDILLANTNELDKHYKMKNDSEKWLNKKTSLKSSYYSIKRTFEDYSEFVNSEVTNFPSRLLVKLKKKMLRESNGVYFVEAYIFTDVGGYDYCTFYFSKNTKGKWKLSSTSHDIPKITEQMKDVLLTDILSRLWYGEYVVAMNFS